MIWTSNHYSQLSITMSGRPVDHGTESNRPEVAKLQAPDEQDSLAPGE